MDSLMSYKRNNDVNQITIYIMNNLSIFNNLILLFDRLNHTYQFINLFMII